MGHRCVHSQRGRRSGGSCEHFCRLGGGFVSPGYPCGHWLGRLDARWNQRRGNRSGTRAHGAPWIHPAGLRFLCHARHGWFDRGFYRVDGNAAALSAACGLDGALVLCGVAAMPMERGRGLSLTAAMLLLSGPISLVPLARRRHAASPPAGPASRRGSHWVARCWVRLMPCAPPFASTGRNSR